MNGVEVVEANYLPLRGYPKLFFKSLNSEFDAIIVGYSYGRSIENFLARISSRKPIFFDAFISQYDTFVLDRKVVNTNSIRAKFLYYRELFHLKCADCVILDTNAHITYFKELYPLKDIQYGRVFLGADDSIAFPKKNCKSSDKFVIFFWGTYIPLQGIEFILKAAKILEKDKEIIFFLVGKGQTFDFICNLAKDLCVSNVKFIPRNFIREIPTLIDLINQADVCLGIFGITNKAGNVIPNKVYESLAMAKPIITGDSPAIRELLTNKINCVLCERGNGKSLADAILLLKNDANLRKKIASNGYLLFKEKLTPQKIGNSLSQILYRYI